MSHMSDEKLTEGAVRLSKYTEAFEAVDGACEASVAATMALRSLRAVPAQLTTAGVSITPEAHKVLSGLQQAAEKLSAGPSLRDLESKVRGRLTSLLEDGEPVDESAWRSLLARIKAKADQMANASGGEDVLVIPGATFILERVGDGKVLKRSTTGAFKAIAEGANAVSGEAAEHFRSQVRAWADTPRVKRTSSTWRHSGLKLVAMQAAS